jgi:hypothetical protein
MVGIEIHSYDPRDFPLHRDGKDRCKRVHLKFAAHKSTSGETDSVRLGDNATLTSPTEIHADSLLFVRDLSTATDVKRSQGWVIIREQKPQSQRRVFHLQEQSWCQLTFPSLHQTALSYKRHLAVARNDHVD